MTRALREERRRDDETASRRQDDGSVGAAVEEVRRLPEEDVTSLAQQVSSDWGAEREADAVADEATADFDGPVLEGDHLSAGLQSAMQTSAPGLGDLDQVRFDQSSEAAQANESIDALAFTQGTDVAVGAEPLTAHTAAHEAAHASMHADDGMVHAKLRGTRGALLSMGGEVKKRGLFGSGKTQWERIIEGLGAYENLEAGLLRPGGNPTPGELQPMKGEMVAILRKIERDIVAWQAANDEEGQNVKKEEWNKKAKTSNERQTSDTREKAQRRQAINMLVPRIGNEIRMLESQGAEEWMKSLGLTTTKIVKQGKEQSGQVNTVKQLTYETESGEFSGYFKEEKGFVEERFQGHEAEAGISQADPNYGARSVAMYKLDQLFNAGVTARAEFAVHVDKSGKSVLGTVLEQAKGTQGSKTKLLQAGSKNKGTKMDDPVLQQGLNKLQLLDAICGQLDRHSGNYFIQTDEEGNVTGVTGIDLDMAFGKDQKSEKFVAQNFKGIPAKIDAEFAESIIKVEPGDIQNALRGLLPEAEIAATIARFTEVKNRCLELKQTESLVKKWDTETAESGIPTLGRLIYGQGIDTYQAEQALQASKTIVQDCETAVKGALSAGWGRRPFQPSLVRALDGLNEKSREMLVNVAGGGINFGEIPMRVREVAWNAKLGDQAVELAMLTVNEMLRDRDFVAAFKEQTERSQNMGEARGFIQPYVQRWVAAAQPKMAKPEDQKEERKGLLGGQRGKKR